MIKFYGLFCKKFKLIKMMENNKYNDYYSGKSVKDLISQLRLHRITGNTYDEKWYEALKVHLSQRNLTEAERERVEHILSANPDTLELENQQEEKLKESEKEDYVLIDSFKIITVGKNLQSISRIILIGFFVNIILTGLIFYYLSGSTKDFGQVYQNLNNIKTIALIMGIFNFIIVIRIADDFDKAGDNLIKSVQKKSVL